MPFDFAMVAQLSPSSTMWNLLQLSIMPGWMGVGVVIPLVGLVGAEDVGVDGVVPILLTQT